MAAAEHPTRRGLVSYISLLAMLATGGILVVDWLKVRAPGAEHLPALVVLVPLLVASEHLFVRFRFKDEVSSINLVEAVLAPLLFAFPGVIVIAAAGLAPAVVALLRRNAPMKAAFNIVQWTLAATCGALVVELLSAPGGANPASIATVTLAVAVVGLVNHAAFAGVMTVVRGSRPSATLLELGPTLLVGWVVGWVVNTLTGLLFVAAYVGHPASVVLFPLPLIVLHVAYRSYAGARTDRLRLAGLHRAAGALSASFTPDEAVVPFLREVAVAFEAQAAALVLVAEGSLAVTEVRVGSEPAEKRVEVDPQLMSFEAAAVTLREPARVDGAHPLAVHLAASGWRSALVAPLVDEAGHVGALVVFDQEGLEGFEEGELAVIEAFARETAASLRKAELVAEIVQERTKLAEIVNSTSDAMCTIDSRRTVRTWNPACEVISGLPAAAVLGKPMPTDLLRIRTPDGGAAVLDLEGPVPVGPTEVHLTTVDGREVRLSCSYSVALDGEERVVVVVARDVTPVEEAAALREQVDELAAAEAAHRVVVERLQEALTPPPPVVEGVGLGVAFRASDPASPTGGDLHSWQVLPDGDLLLMVVDVLGHGVEATRDALTVISTLRILALQGCALGELIERADGVLAAGEREVVATVVLARFDPRTRRLRIASGGHPPALVVSPTGVVQQLAAPGCAIGWPGAGSLVEIDTRLEDGDALVLYTDGLVEARKDILEGLDVLVATAAAASPALPAVGLADALLARCLDGAARSDDSLVLVMRAGTAPEVSSVTLPADPDEVPAVRSSLCRWLRDHGVLDDVVDELRLVASELLANSVRAAVSEVRCEVALVGPWITLEVADDGEGEVPDLEIVALAPPDSEGGRGLAIVRSLVDDLRVQRDGGWTTVRATLRALPEPTADAPAPRIDARAPSEADPGRP